MSTRPSIVQTIMAASALAVFAGASCVHAANQPIRINEIMYDPPQQSLGENLEWIELYNQSPNVVTITGGAGQNAWTLQDQYGTHYFASQPFTGSMTMLPGTYAVLADDPQAFIRVYPFFQGTLINVPLALSSTQGTVSIRDGQGTTIAQASWNQTEGGAGNGKTLEYSTQDGGFREGLRIGGSPGLANSVEGVVLPPRTPPATAVAQTPPLATPQQPDQPQQESFPVIDEIYSNPFPNQSAWIELKNETKQSVNLDGWSLHVGSQPNLILLNGVMDPGSLMLISGSAWGFSMNPQTDSVQIVDPQKNAVFTVSYTSALPQGWSANRIANGSWQASSEPTPGAANIIKLPDTEPVSIPVSEVIPPVGANAYEPSPVPHANQISAPSLVALGFALGAGIAGVFAFVIVKKRFLY